MATSRLFRTYLPDQKADQGVGILLPLNKDTYEKTRTASYIVNIRKNVGVFSQSSSTEEQAISNMVNLLLTRKGERVMQPTFGSPIPDYQFEQNSLENMYDLEVGVREAIQFWLPYIDLLDVNVQYEKESRFNTASDENSVSISISFKITKMGANRTITIDISPTSQPVINVI